MLVRPVRTAIDLELLLSIRHERVVRNDNTVTFKSVILQLPTTRERMHFVRCPVTVHQFPNQTLGVSYQGRLLASPAPASTTARYTFDAVADGDVICSGPRHTRIADFPSPRLYPGRATQSTHRSLCLVGGAEGI